jgi:hypothetical protein
MQETGCLTPIIELRPSQRIPAGQAWFLILVTALSMSLGWRIRGQIGHSANPGVLAALAVVLLCGRPDWWRRAPQFALFGALGWAIFGTMSYMKVVAFSQSGDSATVLYGFAGLFLIGFLAAGFGGVGLALPALLDGEEFRSLFAPLACVFAVWFLQDIAVDLLKMAGAGSLNWRGTNWLTVTAAGAAGLIFSLVRRRWNIGISLIVHLCLGWWAGMLLLVVLLGLHLNPPRNDNWAGCVGMLAGLLLFGRRYHLRDLNTTVLTCGFLGGTGFVLGQIVRLALQATGDLASRPSGGWHAILEWSQGLFLGVALALAALPLIRRGPKLEDDPPRRWTGLLSVFIVLWVIPYQNFRITPRQWVQLKVLSAYLGGLPAVSDFLPSRGFLGWTEILFLAFGLLGAWLVRLHLRRPLRLVPNDPLAQAQALYIAFAVALLLAHFTYIIVRAPRELLSLANPFLSAIMIALCLQTIVCIALMFAGSEREWHPAPVQAVSARLPGAVRILAAGLAAAMLIVFSGWGLERGLYGTRSAGSKHVRFGPDNTNTEP